MEFVVKLRSERPCMLFIYVMFGYMWDSEALVAEDNKWYHLEKLLQKSCRRRK